MAGFISGNFFTMVDKGRVRAINEDFADARLNAYGHLILVVADGMGGQNCGDFASSTIGNGLINDFFEIEKPFKNEKQAEKWLYRTINKFNRIIYQKAHEDIRFSGTGTTLTCAIIFGENLVVAQVGDSRLYKINELNQLEQMTIDQSYVQHLVATGKISPSQVSTHPERHKLTNAIGIRFNAMVDIKSYRYNGEKLLLCSDGLYNNVPFYDIQSILKSRESPERKCHQFIAFGNSNGGSDNMAVVIWEDNHQ